MPAVPDSAPSLEPIRVLVVEAATSAHTARALEELRREAVHVEVSAPADVGEAPRAPVVVVCVTAAAVAALAPRLVAWAAHGALRAGLLGIVEDGEGAEAAASPTERLLAEGFDDAVRAPVSARELVARVRALHRRVHWKGVSNGRLRYAELTLDLYQRELWLEGQTVPLTAIELAVVRELMKARGKPLSRLDLLERAWGDGDLEVSERAVDNVILRLRRKLPRPEVLETVRSVGFRLAPRGPVSGP